MKFKVGDRVTRIEGYNMSGYTATVRATTWDGREDTIVVDFDDGPHNWFGYAARFMLLEPDCGFEVDE